jgi:TetR/AcrR family transcriptional repressor of nem operon
LLTYSARLFREKGFENVTVGEVMKAAGLTYGAFYAHFSSKQELQEAAIAQESHLSDSGLARRCRAGSRRARSEALK